MALYFTWYEFKKDLEKQACRNLLNSDWLRVKPREPLPWDDSCMRSTLVEIKRLQRQKNSSRRYSTINQAKVQSVIAEL
jgi:hypothetical protein